MLHATIDTQTAYDEMLDECNAEIVIGTLTYSPSHVLRLVDPIAYQIGLSEFVDSLDEDTTDDEDTSYHGWVCHDCTYAIANGPEFESADEGDRWATAVEAHDPTDGGKFTVALGDDENTFATSKCDYCGSWLAGYRHAAVWIENN
jgi:hypothetical protein